MFIHVHYVIGIWAQPSLASWILRGCHKYYNVYWVTNAFPVIPVQGGRFKPVAGANHAESAAYIGSCQEEQARDPRARPSWRSHCGAYRREFQAMPTKMRFFESCCPDLIPTQHSTLHCVHCVSMERLDSQQR